MQPKVDMLSCEKLISKIEEGEIFEYFHFWGHKTNLPIDKSCLSQFYPCRFKIANQYYYFAEQYMMAQKALLFNDIEAYEKIISSWNPYDIKKYGRKVKDFDPEVWDRYKVSIVLTGNFNKFDQSEDLKNFLLSTGNKILVEASPYDRIWGVGMHENDPRINNPKEWAGKNLLGFTLTAVREELKSL